MKKVLLLILCLLMSVSIVACKSKDTESTSFNSEAEGVLESESVSGSADADKTDSANRTDKSSSANKSDKTENEGAADNDNQTSSNAQQGTVSSQVDSLNRVPDEYIPTEPTEKETQIVIEGEKEKITVTEFKRDGYTLWYDTDYFYMLNEDGTKDRITIYGRYDEAGSVSMTVTTNKCSAQQASENLKNALTNNLMEVKSIKEADDVKVKGTLHLTAQNAELSSDYENFYADLPDEVCSAYFVPNGKNASYTVYLSYPPECEEGYGARLEAMFREIVFK